MSQKLSNLYFHPRIPKVFFDADNLSKSVTGGAGFISLVSTTKVASNSRLFHPLYKIESFNPAYLWIKAKRSKLKEMGFRKATKENLLEAGWKV